MLPGQKANPVAPLLLVEALDKAFHHAGLGGSLLVEQLPTAITRHAGRAATG